MRVRLRFLCVDLPLDSAHRAIDVADGSTVGQVMVEHARLNDIEDTLEKLPGSMFLVGNQSAQLDTVLHDGDELVVLRILHGG